MRLSDPHHRYGQQAITKKRVYRTVRYTRFRTAPKVPPVQGELSAKLTEGLARYFCFVFAETQCESVHTTAQSLSHFLCSRENDSSLYTREPENGAPLWVRRSVFYLFINIFTYTTEIPHYFIVWNPNHTQAISFQKCRTRFIPKAFFFFIMLTVIHLHNKLHLGAVKIRNLPSQYLLSGKLHRITAKKVIPQMPFVLRHIFSQLFCQRYKSCIVLILHRNYFTSSR